MARPRHQTPTPAELEVLQVIWQQGPSMVRPVMDALNQQRPRAYTSVMSLMNVMADKGLLRAKRQGRAFVYHATLSREQAEGHLVSDLLSRAFDGSAERLLSRALAANQPSPDELDRIRQLLKQYEGDQP